MDPYVSNMFMCSVEEEDADGVTRAKCRCNLMGRMKRSHDVVINWLAHWLRAAGIPHLGGTKGRPNTCKGMFSMECALLDVPRREGETDEEYGTRSETLLNSMITDLAIDLRYVVLAHPTKKLKALLGYPHLADIKALLPGSRYRNDKYGTTSSVVNARQEEV